MQKIYTKSELAPPQSSGMKAVSLYALLPEDLYVKVTTSEETVRCFVSDPMALDYVKQLMSHLPVSTVFTTL